MAREKGAYTPGIVAVFFGALISVIIGMLFAGINMLTVSVAEVSELPPEEERQVGTVYFIKGQGKGGSGWKRKRIQLISQRPGAIRLPEGELNVWARTSLRPDPKKKDEEGGGLIKVEPSPPNFRINEGEFQVASYVGFPQLHGSKKFVYQAKGAFANEAGIFRFTAHSGFIGSCPIPPIPGLNSFLFNFLAETFINSEEYGEMNSIWKLLSDVSVDGEELVLVIN